jgi:hypothetical protein
LNGGMMRGLSISHQGSPLRVQAASARWIAAALALTLAAWLAALAILLAIANRVHDDVPVLLAIKLPLLQSRPELIFAGESRTVYQVDPNLAARLIGKPSGTVINIAYDAGEPLALEAAIHRQPDRFVNAHLVVSVAPFLFNEGVRSAAVYPQDVAARLAADQRVADLGPQPAALGLNIIDRTQSDDRWPDQIGLHAHYADWDLSGPKARFEIGALCDMVALVRKLTVVVSPWAPRYDRARDPVWRDKDDQYTALSPMPAAAAASGSSTFSRSPDWSRPITPTRCMSTRPACRSTRAISCRG